MGWDEMDVQLDSPNVGSRKWYATYDHLLHLCSVIDVFFSQQ